MNNWHDFYCPACGEHNKIFAVIRIAPDEELTIACPHCFIKWNIKVSFTEAGEMELAEDVRLRQVGAVELPGMG